MKIIRCDRCRKEKEIRGNVEPTKGPALRLLKLPEGWLMDLCEDCMHDLNEWFINDPVKIPEPLEPFEPGYKPLKKAYDDPTQVKSEADILLDEIVSLETQITNLSAMDRDVSHLEEICEKKKSRWDELVGGSKSSNTEEKSKAKTKAKTRLKSKTIGKDIILTQRTIVFKNKAQRDCFVFNNKKFFTTFGGDRIRKRTMQMRKAGFGEADVDMNKIYMKEGWYLELDKNPRILNANITDENFKNLSSQLEVMEKAPRKGRGLFYRFTGVSGKGAK